MSGGYDVTRYEFRRKCVKVVVMSGYIFTLNRSEWNILIISVVKKKISEQFVVDEWRLKV